LKTTTSARLPVKKTTTAKATAPLKKAAAKKDPAASQPASQPKKPRTFSLKQREDLGDARLVLETAVHNLRAASGIVIDPTEAVEALETALTMTEQTIVTLRRVRNAMG
jgi:hypothetical protein